MALLLRGSAGAATQVAVRRENFPVALRVLPAGLRHDLQAVYSFARWVDDLGEDRRHGAQELDLIAADLDRIAAGRRPRGEVVAALQPVVVAHRVPIQTLRRLIEANRHDLCVTDYDTFEDLRDYCRLSADPVGEIVLHLLGRATPDRIELSNRICTALQLLEHWQDIGEDYRSGRIYLPREDIRRFAVRECDLAGVHATAELRHLLAFETTRALAWLDAGAPLVSTLHGPGRLAVSAYVAGGRAAARALRVSGYDPLGASTKPSSRAIAAAWLAATVRWPG